MTPTYAVPSLFLEVLAEHLEYRLRNGEQSVWHGFYDDYDVT